MTINGWWVGQRTWDPKSQGREQESLHVNTHINFQVASCK